MKIDASASNIDQKKLPSETIQHKTRTVFQNGVSYIINVFSKLSNLSKVSNITLKIIKLVQIVFGEDHFPVLALVKKPLKSVKNVTSTLKLADKTHDLISLKSKSPALHIAHKVGSFVTTILKTVKYCGSLGLLKLATVSAAIGKIPVFGIISKLPLGIVINVFQFVVNVLGAIEDAIDFFSIGKEINSNHQNLNKWSRRSKDIEDILQYVKDEAKLRQLRANLLEEAKGKQQNIQAEIKAQSNEDKRATAQNAEKELEIKPLEKKESAELSAAVLHNVVPELSSFSMPASHSKDMKHDDYRLESSAQLQASAILPNPKSSLQANEALQANDDTKIVKDSMQKSFAIDPSALFSMKSDGQDEPTKDPVQMAVAVGEIAPHLKKTGHNVIVGHVQDLQHDFSSRNLLDRLTHEQLDSFSDIKLDIKMDPYSTLTKEGKTSQLQDQTEEEPLIPDPEYPGVFRRILKPNTQDQTEEFWIHDPENAGAFRRIPKPKKDSITPTLTTTQNQTDELLIPEPTNASSATRQQIDQIADEIFQQLEKKDPQLQEKISSQPSPDNKIDKFVETMMDKLQQNGVHTTTKNDQTSENEIQTLPKPVQTIEAHEDLKQSNADQKMTVTTVLDSKNDQANILPPTQPSLNDSKKIQDLVFLPPDTKNENKQSIVAVPQNTPDLTINDKPTRLEDPLEITSNKEPDEMLLAAIEERDDVKALKVMVNIRSRSIAVKRDALSNHYHQKVAHAARQIAQLEQNANAHEAQLSKLRAKVIKWEQIVVVIGGNNETLLNTVDKQFDLKVNEKKSNAEILKQAKIQKAFSFIYRVAKVILAASSIFLFFTGIGATAVLAGFIILTILTYSFGVFKFLWKETHQIKHKEKMKLQELKQRQQVSVAKHEKPALNQLAAIRA